VLAYQAKHGLPVVPFQEAISECLAIRFQEYNPFILLLHQTWDQDRLHIATHQHTC
jgi:hypothetical protein